jgi:hypothetical protein
MLCNSAKSDCWSMSSPARVELLGRILGTKSFMNNKHDSPGRSSLVDLRPTKSMILLPESGL